MLFESKGTKKRRKEAIAKVVRRKVPLAFGKERRLKKVSTKQIRMLDLAKAANLSRKWTCWYNHSRFLSPLRDICPRSVSGWWKKKRKKKPYSLAGC